MIIKKQTETTSAKMFKKRYRDFWPSRTTSTKSEVTIIATGEVERRRARKIHKEYMQACQHRREKSDNFEREIADARAAIISKQVRNEREYKAATAFFRAVYGTSQDFVPVKRNTLAGLVEPPGMTVKQRVRKKKLTKMMSIPSSIQLVVNTINQVHPKPPLWTSSTHRRVLSLPPLKTRT
jgi:hypothetical protein